MTIAPVIGRAEDFTVEVLTELGAHISENALNHIGIDDEHLSEEAINLPQLLFYYNAAHTRIMLREEQTKLKVKRAEANAYIAIKNDAVASGNKVTTDEINARVAVNPVVQQHQDEEVELKAKRSIIKGIIDSIERKGFSLQMVGSIRMREEDWLRRSFVDRFRDDPRRKQVSSALNQVLGASYVS